MSNNSVLVFRYVLTRLLELIRSEQHGNKLKYWSVLANHVNDYIFGIQCSIPTTAEISQGEI